MKVIITVQIILLLSLELHPSIQEYLEEQLQKCFAYKVKIPSTPRPKLPKTKSKQKEVQGRRMSLKGTIKRTRSIYRGKKRF